MYRIHTAFPQGLYVRHTENADETLIADIVGKKYPSFTILTGTGYWKGKKENSLVIEIIGDDINVSDINEIALEIKKVNNQEAVLVQKIENNTWLI